MKKLFCLLILISVCFCSSYAQKIKILDNKDKIKISKIDNLNSDYRETNISISPDGKYIFFMSDRGGMPWSTNSGNTFRGKPRFDGDIYYSTKINQTWRQAVCLPNTINTANGEDEPSISPDGQFVYFQSWAEGWESNGGPYYMAELKDTNWSNPVGLGGGINKYFVKEEAKYKKYATDGMCITPDGNTFIVACGPEYDGNLDLYISKKKNGVWGDLEKMPISTKKDERSVFIAGDGKTLFFASDGYGGYGGLDILKTTLNDDGTFGKVVNIGEPFNTKQDDYGFIVTASGNEACFVRDGDIYFANLNDADNEMKPLPTVIIAGKVLNKNQAVETTVDLIEKQSNTIIATSKSDAKTGEFLFSILEKKGIYTILFHDEKYKEFNKEVSVEETGKFQQITVNIDVNKPTVELKKDTVIQVDKKAYKPNFIDFSLVINFDYYKYNIKENYFSQLNGMADTLKKYQDLKIDIAGHTDASGNDNDNMKLGERRALAVKKYLLNHNISPDRITTQSYGESKLLFPDKGGNDPVNAAKNRRCEIRIVPKK